MKRGVVTHMDEDTGETLASECQGQLCRHVNSHLRIGFRAHRHQHTSQLRLTAALCDKSFYVRRDKESRPPAAPGDRFRNGVVLPAHKTVVLVCRHYEEVGRMHREVSQNTLSRIVRQPACLFYGEAKLKDLFLRAVRGKNLPLFQNGTDPWKILKVFSFDARIDMHH